MRLARVLFGLLLLPFCAGGARAQLITPIDSLHYNSSNGIPVLATQLPRRRITVQGTVVAPDSISSVTNTDVWIMDASGGCNVFASAGIGSFHFGYGDSVQVSGFVKHFNGTAEIDSSVAQLIVTHLGPATVNPEPLNYHCFDVANAYKADNHDGLEGRLLRLSGVHITAGSWPVSAGSVNVTLTIADSTGSTTLFIPKACPLNGSPDPGAKFDVVGIIKQFDSTSPYTTGYEIIPRFKSDVAPACPGPTYVSVPAVVYIDSLAATITWGTDTPSSSTLRYGLTGAYTDSVTDATLITVHTLSLTGLSPRTVYHFSAKSTDGAGTCAYPDQVLVTYPSPGTPGDIALYFNFSVDTTVARVGVPKAQGNVDVHQQLINRINAAKSSLDCALYSFSLSDVADALIAAHARGVTVRLIQDAGNSTTQATRLQTNGIPYITSTYAGNHGQAQTFGIMHSKYLAIDANTGNKDDAYVWTGSWNCSVSGQSDCNNTLVIHDYGVAQAYTGDFNQMWGSATTVPDGNASKMGSRKVDVIFHQYLVGGIPIQVYMSPSDKTEKHMIENIWQSQFSDQFCILDFTSDSLSHSMKAHRDSIPGYVVRGCFEPSSIDAFSEWCKLDGQASCADYWNPRADVLQDGSTVFSLLHHKYQILDEGQQNPVVMTGSHNFSNAANTTNDENTVVIHDYNIANVYFQEFWARYKESGGTAVLGIGGGVNPRQVSLLQSLPNPTRGTALIRYSLPTTRPVSLDVYDLGGRLVRRLASGSVTAGAHEARWDGRDAAGRAVAGGVYFYRLASGGDVLTRKLVMVR